MELIKSVISWDKFFLKLCYEVASKSKDPSSKIGALIVGKNNEIISTGFNGFPRKVKDYKSRYKNRDTKYLFVEHAERNSIFAAARCGTSTDNCRMYVPIHPCSDCAKAIIQSGISTVILDKSGEKNYPGYSVRWKENLKISSIMFKEAGIKIKYVS